MKPPSFLFTGAIAAAVVAAPVSQEIQAADDTASILIEVLVRKGILTDSEAAEIRGEVDAMVAERERVAVEPATPAASAPMANVSFEKGVSELKLSGNARFRYHNENLEGRLGEDNANDKWRYRLRLGSVYSFADTPWSLGVQLETSSSNDSNNANFGGFFDKRGGGINVGRIYAQYETDALLLRFGKHEGPFFLPKMLWDGDINVEGLSETFEWGDWTLHAGQYLIDNEDESEQELGERNVGDDMLFALQGEWNGGPLKLAPIVMAATGGSAEAAPSGANSQAYFHDLFVLALPFEYQFDFGDLKQKLYGAWGTNLKGDELVNDPDSPFYAGPDNVGSKDQFALLGYQMGSAKSAGERQWSLEYRFLEGGSYSPNLSDSDWAGGFVNQQGLVFNYKWQVTDFLDFSATLLQGDTIDDDYDAPAADAGNTRVLLIDGVVKF